MGLDCSHNAWHGAYSAFMRWRKKIAEVAGCGIERLRVVAEQWAEARDMALKKAIGEK